MPLDKNLSDLFLEVSTRAALSSFYLVGKKDKIAADKAAVDTMRSKLNKINMNGRIVIGEGELDEAPMLYLGEKLGTKNGPHLDIAVDPLEGTNFAAYNLPGALSVIAVTEKNNLLGAPETYMDKISSNISEPGVIDLDFSIKKNIHNLADFKNCKPNNLNICLLDRPRHKEIISELKSLNVNIKLISDGDVSGALMVTNKKYGVDLFLGIGGGPEGNLTNSIYLRNKLVEDGAIFYTTSDTETIVQLIAKSKRPKTIDKIVDAIFQIQGGYSLVMLTQKSLIGVRDPYGIRPLIIGKLKKSYVLASETCALDIIGATFVREVENGEIVLIENDKLTSIKPFPPKKVRPCVFEYIYFARPDSLINNKTAYEHRKNLGKELAKENDLDADIVVPVPDSGNAAALGFSQKIDINYEHGLIRNHYVGRTFIEPSQKIRSLGVKLKLNANETTIKNKKIILIDDSLVRGTTSHKIVKMLYDAGAKEVHVRIACPEIKYPDFYGVDTPTKKELLAANKSNDEICKYIGAKSLKFLSIAGLYKAIGFDKRNDTYPQLTDHYFTGDYPVKPVDELGDNKITQLSLLSTASNN